MLAACQLQDEELSSLVKEASDALGSALLGDIQSPHRKLRGAREIVFDQVKLDRPLHRIRVAAAR